MSAATIQTFLRETKDDPIITAALANPDTTHPQIVALAAARGYTFTASDLDALAAQFNLSTDELSDTDLEKASGGGGMWDHIRKEIDAGHWT